MDTDIEELRDLLKKNIALTEETYRIVQSMRSAARWSRFFSLLWWAIVLAVSGATYYYWLQPYVEKAQQAYTSGQGFEQQLQDYVKQFGGGQQ